MRRYETKLDLV